MSEAKTYRVELAHDQAFKQVAASVEVGAETLSLSLDNIPAGRYFARVAARDRRRLEGEPSQVLPVDVVAVASSRRMSQVDSGRWEVVALTRLGLGKAGEGLEWALGNGPDDGVFVPGTEALRVVSPGETKVRLRRAGGMREVAFVFDMLPVTASFAVAGAVVDRPVIAVDGEPLTLGLTLTDPRGLAAPLPELALVAEPGGPLVMNEVGPGRYEAKLPAPTGPDPSVIEVSARWLDGSVGGIKVAVDASGWKVPYVYRWKDGLPAPLWDGRFGATALPSIVPIDRVGVSTHVGIVDGEGHVGVALTGEIGLGEVGPGELVADARLTLFKPPLSRDRAQENEVGDLELGLRWMVLDEVRVAVAPSLRVRVPLTSMDDTRVLGLEPGMLFRYRADRSLWLDMRQALFVTEDIDGGESRVGWVSDYAALARLGGAWSLAGLMSLDVPLHGGGAVGVGLGLGGFVTIDRMRVGLHLGAGLTEGAWSRSGDLTLGLSFDVGLGTP